MRVLLILPALLSINGCAPAPAADRGLCDGLMPLAVEHGRALLHDGGDRSVVSGERLIAGLQAGCEGAR